MSRDDMPGDLGSAYKGLVTILGFRRHGLHMGVVRYILLDISTRYIAPIYRLAECRRLT